MYTFFDGLYLFRCIFGGVIGTTGEGDIVRANANPILLTGFILGVIGLLLLVFIFVNNKIHLLNHKAFTIVVSVAIGCFLIAGTLFCFKEVSIKNQIGAVVVNGQHIDPETLSKLVVSVDTGDLAFIIASFVSAASLGGVLLINKFIKE